MADCRQFEWECRTRWGVGRLPAWFGTKFQDRAGSGRRLISSLTIVRLILSLVLLSGPIHAFLRISSFPRSLRGLIRPTQSLSNMSRMFTTASDDRGLTSEDVTALVLDYLSTKGFTETESVFKQEMQKESERPVGKQASAGNKRGAMQRTKSSTKLEDLLEKSYVTEYASGEVAPKKRPRSHLDAMLRTVDDAVSNPNKKGEEDAADVEKEKHLDTKLISYNPMAANDPYGASVMPLYQTSTFAQPAADQFGDYDYTRSGNPTRDMLQLQIANLENSPGCTAFTFTSGMSALTTVSHLIKDGEEVIVNDDRWELSFLPHLLPLLYL